MRSNAIWRIRILSAAIFIFALILIGRLYFLQIVHGDNFSARADQQYRATGQDLYDRGSIFFEDNDGRLISAATLKNGFLVAIIPGEITDPAKTYRALSQIVELDEETFLFRAEKKDDPYEEIARRVSEEDAHAIEELGLSGVRIYKERWRFYPGEELAAHTIGFVGFQGDEFSGRYGLERYYEDALSRDGTDVYVNFFAEIFANIRNTIFQNRAIRTGDVITSIEPSVQLFLEEKLAEVREEWSAHQVSGVVIDPRTGDIYALAVTPSFDLNNFSEVENPLAFSNPVVESVYEFGSIIKPLTIAAGLDSGAVTRDTSYTDRGSITVDGYTIFNFDKEARGLVPLQEILNQSLNTGAAFVVSKMGNDVFRQYMGRYRIGEETGIDLPGEVAGLVGNLESPRDVEYATASFGQGIAMTPIAAVRALGALANGGVLVTPHVGKRLKYQSGLSKEISFQDGGQAISPETSVEITRMLVEVVDTALLGGTVALPNYSIAAKTGTAQIAKVDGRGYYDDRFLHSFFGYFPAYDAQFFIFLYVLEPRGVRYASQTLTDPFIDTVNFLINYYDIPPDR